MADNRSIPFITPIFRITRADLVTPTPFDKTPNSDRYRLTATFDPKGYDINNKEHVDIDLKPMQDLISNLVKSTNKYPDAPSPLKKGDEMTYKKGDREGKPIEYLAGQYIMNMTTLPEKPPVLLHADGSRMTIVQAKELLVQGCYARAKISFKKYTIKNDNILTVYLNAVQHYKKGVPFGGAMPSIEEEASCGPSGKKPFLTFKTLKRFITWPTLLSA